MRKRYGSNHRRRHKKNCYKTALERGGVEVIGLWWGGGGGGGQGGT